MAQCLHGLWMFEECAIEPDGHFILPDEEGIIWYAGEGYALSRKGRELDFTHGRPKMRPPTPAGGGLRIEQVQFDREDWEPMAKQIYDGGNQAGGFFREVCRRFYDAAGGYQGWLSVGAMLGYPAAPELFVKNGNFPTSGPAARLGAARARLCSWLMSLLGFTATSGMGLISESTTPVGIACQLENYSNLPLWLDNIGKMPLIKRKPRFCATLTTGCWPTNGRRTGCSARSGPCPS